MARPGMGEKTGHPNAPETGERLTETDFAGDRMGNNKLQGDDQQNVHNERQAVPEAKETPDAGPVESAERLDKNERAKAELGKGNKDAKP